MSVAMMVHGGVKVLKASHRVIAIEYSSSPAELAEHQMVIGSLHFLTCSASSGKWWASRKKDVRLVVSALVNASHSSSPRRPPSKSSRYLTNVATPVARSRRARRLYTISCLLSASEMPARL